MSKLKWFKHYNEASSGHTLQCLWTTNNYAAIALYWLVLELISRYESPTERGKIEIPMGVLMRETQWTSTRIERELMKLCSNSLQIHCKPIAESLQYRCRASARSRQRLVTIIAHNWLELQEMRGQKNAKKNDENTTEVRSKKEDVRSKNKADSNSDELPTAEIVVLSEFSPLEEIFKTRRVTEKMQRAFLDAFPDPEWISQEVRRAVAWEEANPKRKKKDFPKFLMNWFSNGWDSRRHTPIVQNEIRTSTLVF